MNDRLKPFLLELQKHYTQYALENVLAMKSVYAIRIFELLQMNTMQKALPKGGIDVELTVQEIRDCCNLNDKYENFGSFREKVIDKAEKEINRVTLYDVTHSYVKTGKSVTSIVFHINMKYH